MNGLNGLPVENGSDSSIQGDSFIPPMNGTYSEGTGILCESEDKNEFSRHGRLLLNIHRSLFHRNSFALKSFKPKMKCHFAGANREDILERIRTVESASDFQRNLKQLVITIRMSTMMDREMLSVLSDTKDVIKKAIGKQLNAFKNIKAFMPNIVSILENTNMTGTITFLSAFSFFRELNDVHLFYQEIHYMLCEYDTSDIYAQYFSFCNSEEMREALEVYFLYFMFCFLSNSNKDTWWTFILHQFWDDDILGNLFEGSVIAKCFFNDHKATFIHLFNCMLNVLMKFLIIRQKDGRLE